MADLEGGLRCPFCQEERVIVASSRLRTETMKRRRRACRSCGKRWWTLEVEEDKYLEALALARRMTSLIKKKYAAQGGNNG